MKIKIISCTVLISVVAVCAIAIYSTSNRWWLYDGSVSIIANGQRENSIKAYAGPDGAILIRLSEIKTQKSDYVYYPDRKDVGVLSSSRQFIYLPGVAFCKDEIPGTIMLSDRIKVETDKNVIIGSDFVEFTSLDDLRIRINL